MNSIFTLKYHVAIAFDSPIYRNNKRIPIFWRLLLFAGILLSSVPAFAQTTPLSSDSGTNEFYLISGSPQGPYTSEVVIGVHSPSSRKVQHIALELILDSPDQSVYEHLTFHLMWRNRVVQTSPSLFGNWQNSTLSIQINLSPSQFLQAGPLLSIVCWNEMTNAPELIRVMSFGGLVIADNVIMLEIEDEHALVSVIDSVAPHEQAPNPLPRDPKETVSGSQYVEHIDSPMPQEHGKPFPQGGGSYEKFAPYRWVDVFDIGGKRLLGHVKEMRSGHIDDLYTLPPGFYIVRGTDGYESHRRILFKE